MRKWKLENKLIKSINAMRWISATICGNDGFDLSASGTDDFGVVAGVHAEGNPEKWPEKAEEADTPSVSGTASWLSPSAHTIVSAHSAGHWGVFTDDDYLVFTYW